MLRPPEPPDAHPLSAYFAMDPLDAQTLFPEPAKVDALGGNEPASVAKPAAKKPKPDTVK